MIDRRALRVTTTVLALAGGLGVYALVLTSDHRHRSAGVLFLFVILAWTFVGSGLVATIRRPDSRFGWLLAGVGLTFLLSGLSDANAALPFTAGLLLASVWIALFIHAVLVYPDGRLEGAVAKLSAAVVYIICTALQLLAVLWMDPVRELPGCETGNCPDNLLLVDANHDLHAAITGIQNMLGGVVGIGVLVVLVRRWRGASMALRRALAPVLIAGGIFMAGYIVVLIIDLTLGLSDDVITAIVLVLYALTPLAFLGGVLRSRLEQASVGSLVQELGAAEPGQLRDALARTLRDPSLQVAYWIPETGGYVDGEGHTVTVAETPQRAATVVEHAGQRVAVVMHDPSLQQNRELTRSAFAAAAIALANERLQADLRARLEELRASRSRIVEAGDAERRRLERNLHDGAQQRLVALSVSLRLARSRLTSDPGEADHLLAAAEDEMKAALAELRELARGIHPAVLDRGLEHALRTLTAREPVPVELTYDVDGRLPGRVEVAAYYVVAEALTNVAKYAAATSARVDVSRRDGTAVVRVADDGIGGADISAGSGLRGLRDRVEALDGRLQVTSPASGGTEVRAEIPLGAGSG